ncbi:MAG: ABC transporter permease, partial [Candidatus Acidiferrales bacterium]
MKELRRFLRQSVLGRWGLAVTAILIICAVGASWLAPYDPSAQELATRLSAPSASHWMGTDQLGRDILSRVLFGARVSMLVSICVVLVSGVVGLAIGSLAGYFGGWLDRF